MSVLIYNLTVHKKKFDLLRDSVVSQMLGYGQASVCRSQSLWTSKQILGSRTPCSATEMIVLSMP